MTTIINSINNLEENSTFQKTEISSKFYSSKLVNYVEPIEINGINKTVFYTELNTNFNIGDRVFILNGNYDSNELILTNKYGKYTDGYRVLGVDGCRIILDLNYTGTLPYNLGSDFIKVYHVETQREFDYINSIKVVIKPLSISDSSNTYTIYNNKDLRSKFSGNLMTLDSVNNAVLHTDSIIYVDNAFNGSTESYNQNNGVPSVGFYVRNGNNWVNITNQIKNDLIKTPNDDYDVKDQLFIKGEDIEDAFGDTFLRERTLYKYVNGKWEIDIKYKVPYISKLNFRFGKYTGTHNDGVFGTNIRKNTWNNATWNSGVFINSEWKSGAMNSKSTAGEKSFYTVLENGEPVQTIDFSNNGGFGYNLVVDSDIDESIIQNGNFENVNVGIAATFSSVDNYFNQTETYNNKISGRYKFCNINTVESNNAKIINSEVRNSLLKNTSLVNSQISESVADNSDLSTSNKSKFLDKEGVKVNSADFWSYTTSSLETDVRGVLKLFISDEDFNKLNYNDTFYISRVNKEYFISSLNNDQKVLLPIETKYTLDIYFDGEISDDLIIVSLKNRFDNLNKHFVRKNVSNAVSNIFSDGIESASIDIDCKSFGWVDNGTSFESTPGYILNPINVNNVSNILSKIFINNGDFKSGYFVNSSWISGDNINHVRNKILKNGSNLEISYLQSDVIKVDLDLDQNKSISPEYELNVGDNIWLSSITQIANNIETNIDGRYEIISILDNSPIREVYLKTLDGVVFEPTSVFKTIYADDSNYVSLNKFSISNSDVNQGLFRRTSIRSSKISNQNFNNEDRNITLRNVNLLRLVNILFKNTNNTVSSGLVYKSHFVNDVWNNGIFFNSIWNKGTFNNGVFNNSYWVDGIFNNGSFINSEELNLQTVDYSGNQIYKLWLDGTFNLGEFINSIWAKGTFNNGRFYNSNWYSGVFNNGILGISSIPFNETKMGYDAPILISTQSTIWNNGIVDNALVGGDGVVYWNNGKFNNGEITSFGSDNTKETIWYKGDFNGGKFNGLARWKNGNFYKGKFLSHYGYTFSSPINPSTYSTDYGWENGKFFGGEFGNADMGTNSVWYDGEFRGGLFTGRFWYNGVFINGNFIGSGTTSIYKSNQSPQFEFDFADSFKENYYGLWYNGYVTDTPQNVRSSERSFTEIKRKKDDRKIETKALLERVLWKDGNFNHKTGTIQTSLWLNGTFLNGSFDSSVFNPYIDRDFTGSLTNSSFVTSSCVWENGTFDSTLGQGSFYVSEWKKGTFNNGYMSGGIWRDGRWNYGYADNIYWENGLWRNGNWNGSPFDYTNIDNIEDDRPNPYKIESGRALDIMLNISNETLSNKLHLINVFSASVINSGVLTDVNISSVNGPTSSWFYNVGETYNQVTFEPSNTLGVNSTSIVEFDKPDWVYTPTFSVDSDTISNNTSLYTIYNPLNNNDRDVNKRIIRDGVQYLYIAESPKLYATLDNNDINVFTSSSSTYEIELDLTVELTPEVYVEFGVGNTDIITYTFSSNGIQNGNNVDYWPNQYKVKFIYNTPSTLTTNDKTFYIKKLAGGIFRLLRSTIIEKVTEYHPTYNNTLYEAIVNDKVEFPLDPPSPIPSTGVGRISAVGSSDTGGFVSIYYGNGVFKSGIWENGIWNNGLRSNKEWFSENDYYRFSNIIGVNGIVPFGDKNTYKINESTWLITIKSIESLSGLVVGDKVSIGNIVSIDVNEKRRLIKDVLTITNIDPISNTITVRLIVNFPIRRIERDSENHLIYLTKNIWLTGAFLNGYFAGVWNNGLFKGSPSITLMNNTQWIDGKFDGGRFISRTFTDETINRTYNTSLIQKFNFVDNSSEDLKYTSWIDTNYNSEVYSKLNQESFEVVDESISRQITDSISNFVISGYKDEIYEGLSYSYFKNLENLKGIITNDILESDSTFRNTFSTDTKSYRLGTKATKFDNLIPNNGDFIYPVQNTEVFTTGDVADLSQFLTDGWTFSDFSGDLNDSFTESFFPVNKVELSKFGSNPVEINSNINSNTNNKLQIKSATRNGSALIVFWALGYQFQIRFIRFKLNNTNINNNVLRNRYYNISLDFSTYSMSIPNINNSSATTEFGSTSSQYIKLIDEIDEKETSGSIKNQYFFNRRSLDLTIDSTMTAYERLIAQAPSDSNYQLVGVPNPELEFNFIFNNISFFEVDMIPFFKYWTQGSIDNNIKTNLFAIAPFIDYSNVNFDFIGNVNLTIDTDGILGQNVSSSVTNVNGVSGTINTIGGVVVDTGLDE